MFIKAWELEGAGKGKNYCGIHKIWRRISLDNKLDVFCAREFDIVLVSLDSLRSGSLMVPRSLAHIHTPQPQARKFKVKLEKRNFALQVCNYSWFNLHQYYLVLANSLQICKILNKSTRSLAHSLSCSCNNVRPGAGAQQRETFKILYGLMTIFNRLALPSPSHSVVLALYNNKSTLDINNFRVKTFLTTLF